MIRRIKNVTVAIPDRQARIWALCHNTSLSAVVAYLLQNLDAAFTARRQYDAAARR